MTGYDIKVYLHDPNGYGDWGCPYGFVKELVPTIELYLAVENTMDSRREKGTMVLTDYYVDDDWGRSRLYVPEGVDPKSCGLNLVPALCLVV